MKKHFVVLYLLIVLTLTGLLTAACGDTSTISSGPAITGQPTTNFSTNATTSGAASTLVQPTETTITADTPTVAPTTRVASTATPTVPAPTHTAEPVVKAAPLPDNGPGVINLNKTLGELKLELEISPAKIGNNTFIVRLSRVGTEQAVTNARLVKVNATMLDMDMGVAKLELKPIGAAQPGLYSGEDYLMSMYGKYRLDLLIQVPGQPDSTASFEVSVTTS